MRDPRFPAVPIETEVDTEHLLINQLGETRESLNFIYSAEDTERIRSGYCCLQCGESQVDKGAPFPEACWVCGFRMRDKQAERFAKEFKGNVRVGPSTSIEEELAIAQELVEQEQRIWKPQILVPRGI